MDLVPLFLLHNRCGSQTSRAISPLTSQDLGQYSALTVSYGLRQPSDEVRSFGHGVDQQVLVVGVGTASDGSEAIKGGDPERGRKVTVAPAADDHAVEVRQQSLRQRKKFSRC